MENSFKLIQYIVPYLYLFFLQCTIIIFANNLNYVRVYIYIYIYTEYIYIYIYIYTHRIQIISNIYLVLM